MKKASLSISNVTKSFGPKVVLENLSFTVNPGEFIVLVGPSGCGKSTMLRAIAGLEKIDQGKIVIGETDVTGFQPKDRDIAMVFQDYALYPHKNVYENIAFGLRIRGMDSKEIDPLVQNVAEKLDLLPYLKRKPIALSGGQRQRVAIGRAIVRNPKVFLFDEPLSNLDAKLRVSMRLTIAKLHKELGVTIVYVTHDQVEAMTLADRIIVLNDGLVQQMGTPLELYYHPQNVFVATFIGSPTMNLIEGRLELSKDRSGGDALTFVSSAGLTYEIPGKFAEKLKSRVKHNQPVIWGVRPEDFRTAEGGNGNSDEPTFTVKVIVTEILGPSTSILCDLMGHEIQVMLSSPHRPARDDQIKLRFCTNNLYLFDQASGCSIMNA